VAANAYFSLASDGKPDTFILLGPNHTGYGNPLSAMRDGAWRTPLGDVSVDDVAHRHEHSIEVQLPFLQYMYGSSFKFVPICFLIQDMDTAAEIGRGLAEVLANRNAIVIASSDMTHYEPQASVNRKDQAVLKAIEELNVKKLYNILEADNVSACGYGPIAAVMTYAKALGAEKSEVLAHKTSGDVTGDKSAVVGYAAVSFKKP
jgi:AmmeMemoRadiSam system protein B